jgi:hypothetical protein
VDEAMFDLELMDYDFQIFHDVQREECRGGLWR